MARKGRKIEGAIRSMVEKPNRLREWLIAHLTCFGSGSCPATHDCPVHKECMKKVIDDIIEYGEG